MNGASIEVDRRFRGPPHSGNGGYVAGLIARHAGLSGGGEVTLRAPTPLNRPLSLLQTTGGEATLMDGMTLIAAAKPARTEVGALPRVTIAEAEAATGRTIGASRHLLPECFVCGPDRRHGDGLGVYAGPLDAADTEWTGALAAYWAPDASFADEDGLVAPEFVWAALDCPTGYTAIRPDEPAGGRTESILLGRLTARVERRPKPGEPCAIVTKLISREGRKITADGILRDASGEVLAIARALWITVDRAVVLGQG